MVQYVCLVFAQRNSLRKRCSICIADTDSGSLLSFDTLPKQVLRLRWLTFVWEWKKSIPFWHIRRKVLGAFKHRQVVSSQLCASPASLIGPEQQTLICSFRFCFFTRTLAAFHRMRPKVVDVLRPRSRMLSLSMLIQCRCLTHDIEAEANNWVYQVETGPLH